MRMTTGGELLINTTSDAGDYKLQVNGQAYFGTNITTSSILFYNNSSTNTGIEITAGAGSNTIQNSAYLRLGDGTNSKFITQQINSSYGLDYWFYDGSWSKKATMTNAGALELSSTIKTAAPTGGTAKPYKWGEAGVAIGGSDGYAVKVEIDGTLYYLMTGYLPEPEPEAQAGPSSGYKAKFEEPVIKIKSDNQKIKDLEKEIAELKELIKSKIK